MEEEMNILQEDINHLMDVQNRQEPDLDLRGYPVHDFISEEIGRLEKVWGELYDKKSLQEESNVQTVAK
jgi:hypothetical protein